MNTINKTLFIGKVFHFLPIIDSTNSFALALIKSGEQAEGTIIFSPDQRAGRGQAGTSWHSSANKNIALSVIFQPSFLLPVRQFALSQAIALGVRDFLSGLLNAPLFIKWPNDLYVRDQKIGGILLQNGISGNRFRYCIAGIGLNINEKIFPKEVPNPTSLFLETGIHHPPEDLLEQLCLTLEKRYLQLKAGKREALQQAYLDHLYKYQEESWFQETGGKPFRAMITGVNTDGKLEVTLSTGEKRTYSNKEVIYM